MPHPVSCPGLRVEAKGESSDVETPGSTHGAGKNAPVAVRRHHAWMGAKCANARPGAAPFGQMKVPKPGATSAE